MGGQRGREGVYGDGGGSRNSLWWPKIPPRYSEIPKGALEKEYLHKIVQNFPMCDKVATILRTLQAMHKTKHQQFCAILACNLRQICDPPLANAPFSGCLFHRVLQGSAQGGAQSYFIFAVHWKLLSCSRMSRFYLKTCSP